MRIFSYVEKSYYFKIVLLKSEYVEIIKIFIDTFMLQLGIFKHMGGLVKISKHLKGVFKNLILYILGIIRRSSKERNVALQHVGGHISRILDIFLDGIRMVKTIILTILKHVPIIGPLLYSAIKSVAKLIDTPLQLVASTLRQSILLVLRFFKIANP